MGEGNSADTTVTSTGHPQNQSITFPPHEIRSPLAATRANSLASAASPTGSACTKSVSDTGADSPRGKVRDAEPMFLV